MFRTSATWSSAHQGTMSLLSQRTEQFTPFISAGEHQPSTIMAVHFALCRTDRCFPTAATATCCWTPQGAGAQQQSSQAECRSTSSWASRCAYVSDLLIAAMLQHGTQWRSHAASMHVPAGCVHRVLRCPHQHSQGEPSRAPQVGKAKCPCTSSTQIALSLMTRNPARRQAGSMCCALPKPVHKYLQKAARLCVPSFALCASCSSIKSLDNRKLAEQLVSTSADSVVLWDLQVGSPGAGRQHAITSMLSALARPTAHLLMKIEYFAAMQPLLH